jgi:hypothetical protein
VKKFSLSRGPGRSGGPWMPKQAASEGLNPEQEREAESDDLAELLAATNAKRAARGKAPLSQDDVAMQVWAAEQEIRRPGPPG